MKKKTPTDGLERALLPAQRLIEDSAARWLIQFEDPQNITPAQHADFLAWCAADPRHIHSFRALRRSWEIASALVCLRPEIGARAIQ